MKKIEQLSENYRLIIAVLLSTAILVLWQTLVTSKRGDDATTSNAPHISHTMLSKQYDIPGMRDNYDREAEIAHDIVNGKRVEISTPSLKGSINLVGASIDDITLLKYKESQETNSRNAVLLAPHGDQNAYTTSIMWVTDDDARLELPTKSTLWTADRKNIHSGETVNLHWINKQGVKFVISITADDKYMFQVKQTITNLSGIDVSAHGSIAIDRIMRKGNTKSSVNSELVGVVEGALDELKQDDMEGKGTQSYNHVSWLGFGDKYWLVSAIVDGQDNRGYASYVPLIGAGVGAAHIELTHGNFRLQAGNATSQSVTSQLFIGVKELDSLEHYSKQYDIPLFDRAIDFGMLYFITKPMLMLLVYFYKLIGNFGLAILLLTVVVKVVLFPLAHKGFVSMNRMKDLQPRILQLRDVYKDNTLGLQKAISEMYKREKVSPLSGCLPMLLQMPIFISLYKVLSITLEMRFAPFFGWITDLSAADPTSIFNLFGLINWTPPAFLMIGVLPLLMGGTMFMQQHLNPQPTDPTQSKVMKVMPIFMTCMFASFPSGLVLYWTCSNILSIIQQIIIRKLSKFAKYSK